MQKMDGETWEEIRKWMMQHARPLEISLWKYFYEGSTKSEVLDVLLSYQNEDGGFGQGLEPDNWNPNSTPATTRYAINVLRQIEFEDKEHPIFQGILKYLESDKNRKDYGWMFGVPSNRNYPHAPWWDYKEERDEMESRGLTAELSAFLLENASLDSESYHLALEHSWRLTAHMMKETEHGDMGICGYIRLTECIRSLQIPGFDCDRMEQRIGELITGGIEQDTTAWKNYGHRPSEYISSPQSPYYQNNREIVEKELNYLMDTRVKHDVWPITWTWFEHNEKFPGKFPISEIWWKGIKTIENTRFLQAFEDVGRVENR